MTKAERSEDGEEERDEEEEREVVGCERGKRDKNII